MRKYGLLLLSFVILLMAVLSACGGPESHIASAETLQQDLAEQAAFQCHAECLDVTISDLEIVKRQTTVENKIDRAWVHAYVSGPRVEGEMYYLMTYELYNDGWLLENVEEDDRSNWKFTPLVGPSEDVWKQYAESDAENLEVSADLDSGTCLIAWSMTETYNYADFYTQTTVPCYFDAYSGEWQCVEPSIEREENWKIDGTWHLEGIRNATTGLVYERTIEINGFDAGARAHIHVSTWDDWWDRLVCVDDSFVVDVSAFYKGEYIMGGQRGVETLGPRTGEAQVRCHFFNNQDEYECSYNIDFPFNAVGLDNYLNIDPREGVVGWTKIS